MASYFFAPIASKSYYMKDLKIVGILENELKDSQNILIALVSLPEYQNNNSPLYNLTHNYVLVYPKSSIVAHQIYASPEEPLEIEFNDFHLRKIRFDGIPQKFGYLHKDLLKMAPDEKKNQDLEDFITECIFCCHPEMFLYYTYYFVLKREFELDVELSSEIQRLSLKRFREVASVILMKVFHIKTEYSNLPKDDIDFIQEKYQDAINYLEDFPKAIRIFVRTNKNVLEVSKDLLNDDDNCTRFIQEVMFKGGRLAEKRILNNMYSTEYFGHELVVSDKRVELKIFPTPLALSQVIRVNELFKAGELQKNLIAYLSRHNIRLIENEKLTSRFGTKWIFRHEDIMQTFYLDRQNSLSNFFCEKQKRNNFFGTLFKQGQINITTEMGPELSLIK